ncbi:MAG TPA: M48 family metallopeptidase, partial [Isosphaeraceae bacterium]|nr:M48 family metallopeptidase [Isosphaeraceae bacterium]
ILAFGILVLAVNLLFVVATRWRRRSVAGLRQRLSWSLRAVDLVAIGLYTWILQGLEWPRFVASNLNLKGWILVDELLVLAPFVVLQILGWTAMFPAERALRPSMARSRFGPHLIRKARQSLGLVLPMALIYGLGRDLLDWLGPEWREDSLVQLGCVALMSILVLGLSPAFVRLAWPTHPLPPGALRDRLERLARRLKFAYTDILIWDTEHAIVNAGVTGALPWFRYVLLTDELVDELTPLEIEAVFGHEVGHVAHRHLLFFGLFFLGSLGVLALLASAARQWLGLGPGGWTERWLPGPLLVEAAEELVLLAMIGGYLLMVFGFLSRRFERQADLYGCRAVSCGQTICPPHHDLNAAPDDPPVPLDLCPVGIRIFADALENVAVENGLDLDRHTWRHGSIRQRIHFLESLEGRPERVRRFQARLVKLRVGLVLVLALTSALAIWLADALGNLLD